MNFHKSTLSILATFAIVTLMPGITNAATISENFDSTAVGATPPTGWTTVGVGSGDTYEVTATGNPLNCSSMDAATGGHNNGNRFDPPNVYLVNSGEGFDATRDFSGSFDFYTSGAGNYATINFIAGDIQNGLTSTSAGEYLNVGMSENTFGFGSNIMNGAGGFEFETFRSNDKDPRNYYLPLNAWTTATVTWTADTGIFAINWAGLPTAMTTSGYSFDANEVFLGFGTVNTDVRFDNISFNQADVPEPSTVILAGLGLAGLGLRRGRK